MLAHSFSDYFSGAARDYLLELLSLALREDGTDLTSDGIFSPEDRLFATITAKEDTIAAGLPVIPLVMDLCGLRINPQPYTWQLLIEEGSFVPSGTVVAKLCGAARQVLRAERVILNFVSHVSGVANLTQRYVQELQGTGVRLLDTRKTLPGMRYPAKYGVLCGGGCNHRRNLDEMIMIKDNHIDAAGSITQAVAALRARWTPCPPIEVECRNIDEIQEAVSCRVDRIMLDNMKPSALDQALSLIPDTIETEISGGVSLETIRNCALAGTRHPDFISVGRLTHSAAAADFSMRIAKENQ